MVCRAGAGPHGSWAGQGRTTIVWHEPDSQRSGSLARISADRPGGDLLDPGGDASAVDSGNVFEALTDAVRHYSPGQITEAFFGVGGQNRRNV